MKFLIATTFLIAYVFGCSGIKKSPPSAIEMVSLRNYQLNDKEISFNNNISYDFISNENTFYRLFSMTRASPGSAIIPDFNFRFVVAIILRPSEKVISVDINKAELSGECLNIYYTITDTTSWKTYTQTPMTLVVIKKSQQIKRVRFYSSGLKGYTIATNF